MSIKSTSAAFSAAALLLSIPSILVTTPALPIPISIRRSTNFPLSKVLIYIITICLAILPASMTRFGSDVILILAFLSTFVVPGTSFFFKLVSRLLTAPSQPASVHSHHNPQLPPAAVDRDPTGDAKSERAAIGAERFTPRRAPSAQGAHPPATPTWAPAHLGRRRVGAAFACGRRRRRVGRGADGGQVVGSPSYEM